MEIIIKQLMGGRQRIPRKIKKAITRPCGRSKWTQRSDCFFNRKWQQYIDQPMQGGQCQTLQARLLLYLTLTGCKYSWRNQTLKCEMPSGVKFMVFHVPKHASGLGLGKFSWYGAALYPYRNGGKVRYLDERAAMYLYKCLGEQIKEKAEKLNQKK